MTYKARFSGLADEMEIDQSTAVSRLRRGTTMWEWSGTDRQEREVPVYVESSGDDRLYRLYVAGEVIDVAVEDARDRRHALLLRQTASGRARIVQLRAPMPGLLKEILVAEGDRVSRGEPLCILEAMKMENELRSPGDFIVGSIAADAGAPLEKGGAIMRLEPLPEQGSES